MEEKSGEEVDLGGDPVHGTNGTGEEGSPKAPEEPKSERFSISRHALIEKPMGPVLTGFKFSGGTTSLALKTFPRVRVRGLHRGYNQIVEAVSQPILDDYDGYLEFDTSGMVKHKKEFITEFLIKEYRPRMLQPGYKPILTTMYEGDRAYQIRSDSEIMRTYKFLSGMKDAKLIDDEMMQIEEIQRLGACLNSCAVEEGAVLLSAPVRTTTMHYYQTRREAVMNQARMALADQLYVAASVPVEAFLACVEMYGVEGVTILPPSEYVSDVVIFPLLHRPDQLDARDFAVYRSLYLIRGYSDVFIQTCQTEFMQQCGFISMFEKSSTLASNTTKNTVRATSSADTTLALGVLTRGSFTEFWSLLPGLWAAGFGSYISLSQDPADDSVRLFAFIIARCFLARDSFEQGAALEAEVQAHYSSCTALVRTTIEEIFNEPTRHIMKRGVTTRRGLDHIQFSPEDLLGRGIFPNLKRLETLGNLARGGPVSDKLIYFKALGMHGSSPAIREMTIYAYKVAVQMADRLEFIPPAARRTSEADEKNVIGYDPVTVLLISASISKSVILTRIDTHEDKKLEARNFDDNYQKESAHRNVLLAGRYLKTGSELLQLNFVAGHYHRIRKLCLDGLSALPKASLAVDREIAHDVAKHVLGHTMAIAPELFEALSFKKLASLSLEEAEVLTTELIDRYCGYLDYPPAPRDEEPLRSFIEEKFKDEPDNIVVKQKRIRSALGKCFGYVVALGRDCTIVETSLSHTYRMGYKTDAATVARYQYLTVAMLQTIPAVRHTDYIMGLALNGPVFIRATGDVSLQFLHIEGSVDPIYDTFSKQLDMALSLTFYSLGLTGVKVAEVTPQTLRLIETKFLTRDELETELVRPLNARCLLLPANDFLDSYITVAPNPIDIGVGAGREPPMRFDPDRNGRYIDEQGDADNRRCPKHYVESRYNEEVRVLPSLDLQKYVRASHAGHPLYRSLSEEPTISAQFTEVPTTVTRSGII